MSEKITIYEPDNSIRRGYWNIFREIGSDLKNNRWLTWQLFKRDFKAAYRQSFIGILWAFIIPVISVSTFIILNQSGILNYGSMEVPYPIFAVLGMAFWSLFSMGLIACSNSLVNAGSMIVKINFSKKSLVIASMGQSIVTFIIQFSLVCILFVIYGIFPDIAILLVIPLMIPLLLLTLGFGFLLAVLNGIVRDIGNLLSVLITFLMFLTPVLYVLPTSGIITVFSRYNPLYYLITSARELILFGTITNWEGFMIACLISVIVFIVSIILFHLTETRIAERV